MLVRVQPGPPQKNLDAEELKNASSYEVAEAAWTDFLLAASTIYSKLEQGSKQYPRSKGWFGKKKGERRDDPLLRYLHLARNSDEHGIEYVVSRGGNVAGFGGKPLNFNERIPVTIQSVDEKGAPIPGTEIPGFLDGPSITLVRVHDRRSNSFCDPPTRHLGEEIEVANLHTVGIGLLGLRYLEALVDEADALQNRR